MKKIKTEKKMGTLLLNSGKYNVYQCIKNIQEQEFLELHKVQNSAQEKFMNLNTSIKREIERFFFINSS